MEGARSAVQYCPGDPNWINGLFLPVGHYQEAKFRKDQIEWAAVDPALLTPGGDVVGEKLIGTEGTVASPPKLLPRVPAWAGASRWMDTPFGRAVRARFDKRQSTHEAIAEFGESFKDALEIKGLHSYAQNSRARNVQILNGRANVDFAATYIINWRKGGLPTPIARALTDANVHDAYTRLERMDTQARVASYKTKKKAPKWAYKPDLDKRLAFWYWFMHVEEPPRLTHRRRRVGNAEQHGMLLQGEQGVVTDLPVEVRLDYAKNGLNPAYQFERGRGATIAPDRVLLDLAGERVIIGLEDEEQEPPSIDDVERARELMLELM